jgi:mannose-1-phosphate guanylyltransferase/mannose-6-phosphate isomerase
LVNEIFKVTPVILCGGSGSRLWPMSRHNLPKQFLSLLGDSSLFQQAVGRISYISNENVKLNEMLIVANEEHRFLVSDHMKDFPSIYFKLIVEPLMKNTAPALTMAALMASEADQDPILFISPADQVIVNLPSFKEVINKAIKTASDGNIVVLGVKPDSAHTGFGYIKNGNQKGNNGEYDVAEFKEKPDLETAKKYIENSNYSWNSGIFIMKAKVWLNALKHCRPDILVATENAYKQSSYDGIFVRPNSKLYEKIPSESIDYAVIEKSPNIPYSSKVLFLDAGWNDLGSWDALWKISNKDKSGNVVRGDVILDNVKDSLVYANNRLVTMAGVDNLIVVETADSVLISSLNDSQNIKNLFSKLELHKREERNLHRKVLRPWGHFDTIDLGENFKVKRIKVNPGQSLSLQKHKKRAEHWVVVKGVATVVCGEKEITLNENESTYIPRNVKHKLSNRSENILELIEIQTGKYLGEDDIERFEDIYGREVNPHVE